MHAAPGNTATSWVNLCQPAMCINSTLLTCHQHKQCDRQALHLVLQSCSLHLMEHNWILTGLLQSSALNVALAVHACCSCMALTSFACQAELQKSVLAELPQIVKGPALEAKKQAILIRISVDRGSLTAAWQHTLQLHRQPAAQARGARCCAAGAGLAAISRAVRAWLHHQAVHRLLQRCGRIQSPCAHLHAQGLAATTQQIAWSDLTMLSSALARQLHTLSLPMHAFDQHALAQLQQARSSLEMSAAATHVSQSQ